MPPQVRMLQGLLVGFCTGPDFPLKVSALDVEVGEDGTYLNTFVLTLFSGTKIRVTVEEEE